MKKEKEILKQGEDFINKPSFLINIKRKGNLVSNKVYNHFLKIVLQEYKTGGNHNGIFHTTIKDIQMFLGRSVKVNNTNEIWKAIKELQQTQIEELNTYRKKDKNTKEIITEIRKKGSYQLLGSCEYTVLDGLLEFDMSPIFLKKIMSLKEEDNLIYTKLEDTFITNFKHKHSLVIYEYLKDYQTQEKVNLTFKNIRVLLDLENKYTDKKDFKKVLIKSFEEIQETTDLKFDYTWKYVIEAGKKEDCVFIQMKKETPLYKQKGLLNFKTFKEYFLLFYNTLPTKQSISLKSLGNKIIKINDNNFITDENGKSLTIDEAKTIWEGLYNQVYLVDPNKIYSLFNTTKENFEMGENLL